MKPTGRFMVVAAVLLGAAASAAPTAQERLSPGEWENVREFTRFEVTGVSPQVQTMMTQLGSQMLHKPQTGRECLTTEEAASAYGGIDPGGNCKFDSFEMRNGWIAATATCQDPEKGMMKVGISGTYDATTVESNQDVHFSAPGGAGTIRLNIHDVRRRVGECPTGK